MPKPKYQRFYNSKTVSSSDYYLVKDAVEVEFDSTRSTLDKPKVRKIRLDVGTLVNAPKRINEPLKTFYIKVVNEDFKYDIDEGDVWRCPLINLVHCDKDVYPLIQPLSPTQKVKFITDKHKRESILKLDKGDSVLISDQDGNYHLSVIRYKGPVSSKGPGVYFGVELLDDHKGNTDGSYKGKPYFTCHKDAGLFVTVHQMKPVNKGEMSKSSYATHSQSQSQWYLNDSSRDYSTSYRRNHDFYPSNLDTTSSTIDRKSKVPLQYSSNDLATQVEECDLNRDYHGDFHQNGDLILLGEKDKFVDRTSHLISPDGGSNESEGNGYYDMSAFSDQEINVGSAVEVIYKDTLHYGVVRWIGHVKGDPKWCRKAGIEMDEEDPDFTDGSYHSVKYFDCFPHRAFFVNLEHCRLDSRITDAIAPVISSNDDTDFGALDCPAVNGFVPPISQSDVTAIFGKNKGIQGHHNSCYLDATLFSMFAFTSVFDSLLYRPAGRYDISDYDQVQRVLKDEIVNPLRKKCYVRADKVMKLRRLMEKLSSVSGLTTEEKDPEEFLTSLVAQILKAEPFLKLCSGQEAFHYQLFVEKNEKLILPTVQQLFEQSFYTSDIKLKEVPSCLIIQMPRFGKSYKMYPRILPSQLLDVTDVIEDSPRQCFSCGVLASYECRNCFEDGTTTENSLQNTSYCSECIITIHKHKGRSNHDYRQIRIPNEYRENRSTVPRIYMELFAVVCIETSHYVTFVKCGDGLEAPWCFFDSMADRKGEQNGYNIPEVVPCPDLPQYISEKGAQSLAQFKDDRHLPEHLKRLLCDAYMCMYQSTDVMMYR